MSESDSHNFSASEQVVFSKLIHQVKDSLLSQKGKMVTPVHYAPKIPRHGEEPPIEQYGLLCLRQSPLYDRRGVLISKNHGQYHVSYHVDHGILSEDEKLDAQAWDKRRAQHATGVMTYDLADVTGGRLAIHFKDYLLDGYLPAGAVRT